MNKAEKKLARERALDSENILMEATEDAMRDLEEEIPDAIPQSQDKNQKK